MEIQVLKGERREPGGRNANERLRRDGKVPAVIYGHQETPETIALKRDDLENVLHHQHHVISVDLGGKTTPYLIKEVQYDHLQHEPLHVDLMRVSTTEKVRVVVPIEFRGEPKGLHEGGVILHDMTEVEIEAPFSAVPDVISVNISALGVGDALRVGELPLPAEVDAVPGDEIVVAHVVAKRGTETAEAEPAEEGEGGAEEPEVIGRGKAETEDEEA